MSRWIAKISSIIALVAVTAVSSYLPAHAGYPNHLFESEPNGRFAAATPVMVSLHAPVNIEGKLNPKADGRDWDFDYYTFRVTKRQAVSIAVSDHGPVDISVDLFNNNATSGFLRQGQSSGSGARLTNYGLAPGRYFVRVYETVHKQGGRVYRRAKKNSPYLLSLRFHPVDRGTSWQRDGARLLPF